MTLEAMIGARLAVGFHGTEASESLIEQLRQLRAQSVVAFSRNFLSPEQFIRCLQRLEEALGYRLLVMVDHEGGRVVRFGQGVTHFPDALSVGKTGDSTTAERQGAVEAEELKRLGVRMNLAPCVDVIVEGCDPVIGDRSYGSDPSRVSAFSIARIRGLQSHGVAACAKHFPGLGAVPRDPHRILPTITLDMNVMERLHLAPFRVAIEANVAAVMSSHVCYPGMGEPPNLPATFSPQLIRTLLRNQLQFPGVIVSDDLEMGALRAFGDMGEVVVRATEAGHDVLLICSDLSAAAEASKSLRRAYQSGRLSLAELESSVERIENLRRIFLA